MKTEDIEQMIAHRISAISKLPEDERAMSLATAYATSQYSMSTEYQVEKEQCIADYLAGWGASQPQWIPVTERMPEELIPVITLIPEEDNEIAICLYEKNEGFYLCYDIDHKPNVEYWCYIPNSLINFKP